MKLDKDKFKENEAKSNHAAVAMQYVDCPLKKEMCLAIATGFGGAPVGLCEHLDFKEGECNYLAEGICPECGEVGMEVREGIYGCGECGYCPEDTEPHH